MKTFILVLLTGQHIATLGPVTGGMERCLDLIENRDLLTEFFELPTAAPPIDYTFICRQASKPPTAVKR